MIKQESILQLKNVIDIVEEVRTYLPDLKKSGKNYFSRCPFHSERTPSFSVSPEKKIIHCFGCGYSGDIIKFVQDIEHISYVEAVEKLAKKYNFVLEYTSFDKETYNERKVLLEIVKEIAEMYHEILLKDKIAADARKYLAFRGIKPETISKFKLGYAPDNNYIATNFKKYDLSTLYKAGVINFYSSGDEKDELKKYEHPYDYFRDRVIFPVFDVSGRIVSFGGRILPNSISSFRENVPVYINGPDTIIFTKGSNLYGLYQSKEEISKSRSVILVEGYMDVLVLFQEGFHNVVAPLGTALTETQVRLLKRFVDTVYLMFDSDISGGEATISASQQLYKHELFPQGIKLPEEVDPDEFVLRYGHQKLEELIANAGSIIKFAINHYLKCWNKSSVSTLNTKEKISLFKKMMEILVVIPNPIAKSDAVREVSEELKISEDLVRNELKKFFRKQKTIELTTDVVITSKPYSCEEELLWICIHYPEKISEIPKDILSHHPEYMEVLKKIEMHYSSTRDISLLMDALEPSMKEIVFRLIFDTKEDISSSELDKRIVRLYEDIIKVQKVKRYRELQPIVADMLEDKISLDLRTINEFKELVKFLKE